MVLAEGVQEHHSPADLFLTMAITLPTKVRLVKAMVFPVIMYGCESLDYEES